MQKICTCEVWVMAKRDNNNKKTKGQKKSKLSFYKVLNMYALIPLITVAVAMGISAIVISN